MAIERLSSADTSRPVLLALAGGPGQSATAFASVFATVLEGALDRYQLLVFDQRGTGRSGVLDCPALRETYTDETIMACGAGLGAAARFYTTADSVLDLDDVRAAVGVEQVVIVGVSYGTHVALEYARTFPARAAAVVLDSTVPSDNVSALGVESFAAVPRVLRELCSLQSCSGFTQDPVADTAALVQRLGQPLEGVVIDAEGRRQHQAIDAPRLFRILEAGDLLPVLHDVAVATLPSESLFPFDRATASQSGAASSCLYWPTTGLDRASSPGAVPDVPALILAGTRDVRTPLQNADDVATLLPRATRVVVPSRGHSLLTGAQCARDAAAAFLHDASVDDPCANLTPDYTTEPPPPRTLRDVTPLGIRGLRGRVLSAVIATLNDAIGSAVTVYRAPGQPVRFGGLRAGRVEGVLDSQSLHLSMTRYTMVPGVGVNGSIDFDGPVTTARARVRGRMAGKLRFGADGSIRGNLGGRSIALVSRGRTAGVATLAHPRTTDVPPIP